MGNLLGSPITDKDTHVGITHDSNGDHAQSSDGGGLPYGISSMQGWRIHMEDAHIAQPFLYAEKLNSPAGESGENDSPSRKTEIEATLSNEEGEEKTEVNVTTKTPKKSANSATTSEDNKYIQIPLPNHALFAVFDGHGGSFAAEYASRNLLRVLCRSENFCQYAEKWRGRDTFLKGERAKVEAKSPSATTKSESTTSGENSSDTPEKLDDKQRLQQLKKRGHESDEKVRQIKERVRKHLDGEDVAVDGLSLAESSNSEHGINDDDLEGNSDYQYAKATYDHEMMTLLERSLKDAFIDVDAEILRATRLEEIEDSNMPYGAGYDLSQHSLEGCIGHLPPESTGQADALAPESSNEATPEHTNNSADHPAPSDDEDAGTTAVVVVTTPKWIVCANAGDSRAVYSRSGHRAVPLSYDHKPDDDEEERRIREAGGYVSGGRVEGDLAVSRGLGDYRFKDVDTVMSGSKGESVRKSTMTQRRIATSVGAEGDMPMLRPSEQKVSPLPDIIVQNRDPKEDEFIIIACDGIWDVQTNQECVRMVADIFMEGESDLGLVCEEILDMCLIKGSKDNMTASVIKFPKQTIGKGGGVTARRERRGAASPNASESTENQGEAQVHLRRVYNPYVPPAQREQADIQVDIEEEKE